VGALFFFILAGFGLLFVVTASVGMALMSPIEATQTGERHVRRVAELLASCPTDVLQAMKQQPETDQAGLAQVGQLLLNASWVLALAIIGALLALQVSLLDPLVLLILVLIFGLYSSFAEATEISNAATVISQAIHAVEIQRLIHDGGKDGAPDGDKNDAGDMKMNKL